MDVLITIISNEVCLDFYSVSSNYFEGLFKGDVNIQNVINLL